MHAAKLKMPTGESDFRRLIQGQYYFVDKSLFIQEVLEDSASVLLMTRPRRFGKTLNLSMLRYFFAKEVEDQKIENLFDGLKIQGAPGIIRQHQGQYPVIFLTFKDLKQSSYAQIYADLILLIQKLYREHDYLLDSPALRDYEKNQYRALLEGQATESKIRFSLQQLSVYLHHHHKIPPIILIDEYDTPIQSGYLHHFYTEIIEFFRSFLGSGLKDNPHCFKAILTGILRISKESLFSGLNNLEVYSVLNPMYGQYFGFTEVEVQILLEKASLKEKAEAIRQWYNGYQIGSHTIYNPWSIISCVKTGGALKSYWLNTSDNALVRESLYQSGLIYSETLEQLIRGETVECRIDEQVVFLDLKEIVKKKIEVILSFLLMAGYLKTLGVKDTDRGLQCQITIPNKEIYSLYADLIENWLVEGQTKYDKVALDQFVNSLLQGDLPAFEASLRSLLENTMSVHDLGQEPEVFYHGLMIGLTASLHFNPDYELKSNRESGYGRYDYLILSRIPQNPTLLMEFKRVKLPKSEQSSVAQIKQALEYAAKQGLEQIEEKGYAVEARQQRGQMIKVALAFCGKRFKLLYSPIISL